MTSKFNILAEFFAKVLRSNLCLFSQQVRFWQSQPVLHSIQINANESRLCHLRCQLFFIIAQLFSPHNTPCCYSFLLSRTPTPVTSGSIRFEVVKTNVPDQINTHYRSLGLSSNTNNSDNTCKTLAKRMKHNDYVTRLRNCS